MSYEMSSPAVDCARRGVYRAGDVDAETSPAALLDPLPGIFNAGFLSLLSGASGIGKTALIAALAVRFRDGGSLFGVEVHPPAAVAYITVDRPWIGARRWFEAVGFPDIRQYSIVDDHDFAMALLGERKNGDEAFAKCVDALDLPRGSLIFVDPMTLFMGGNLLNYHRIATTCIRIHRQLQKSGHCVIGAFHTSKQKEDKKSRYLRAQDRITGSGALLGFSDTQMNLMAPDEADRTDGVYQLLINPHQCPAQVVELTKDAKTGLFNLSASARSLSPLEQLDDDLRTLYLLLPPSPTPISTHSLIQLFADQDMSRATLFRGLKALAAAGLVVSAKRGAWLKVDL